MAEEKDNKKFTTISIPMPLAEKIKKRIEGTGFTSLSSYVTYEERDVTYVLHQILLLLEHMSHLFPHM